MSGFLQRLALRESGALPALSPRLGSWFDPRRAAASAATDDGEHSGEPAAAPSHAPVPAAPAPVALYPERRPAMAELLPQAAARRVLEQGPALAVPVFRAPGEQRDKAALPRQQLAPPPALLAAGPKVAVQAAPRAGDPVRPRTALPVPPMPAPPQAIPARVPQKNAGTPVLRTAQAQQAALMPPAPPAGLARLAPAALQAVRAEEARRSAGQAPAPAPGTIEVTIGRLEVRATVRTQAAAPAQRSKQSPTSLDDYLAKRNGEVRQ